MYREIFYESSSVSILRLILSKQNRTLCQCEKAYPLILIKSSSLNKIECTLQHSHSVPKTGTNFLKFHQYR